MSGISDENGAPAVFDYDKFRRRAIDKINFTSINSDQARNALMGSFLARHIYGADISGGFDWDKILSPEEDEQGKFYTVGSGANKRRIDAASNTGDFMRIMRRVRASQAKGDFLFFDQSLVDTLGAYGAAAYKEISDEVMNDASIPMADKARTIERRYDEVGGLALRHLNAWGLTRENIAANPEMQATAEALSGWVGDDVLWGRGDKAKAAEYLAQRHAVVQRRDEIQQQIDNIDKQIAIAKGETPKEQNAQTVQMPAQEGSAATISAPSVVVNAGTATINTGTIGSSGSAAEAAAQTTERIAEANAAVLDLNELESKKK